MGEEFDIFINKTKNILEKKRDVIESLVDDYFLARKIIVNKNYENDTEFRKLIFWRVVSVFYSSNDFNEAEKEAKKVLYESISASTQQTSQRAVVSKIVSQVRRNISLETGELSRILGISEGFTRKIVKTINDNPTHTNKEIAKWLVG